MIIHIQRASDLPLNDTDIMSLKDVKIVLSRYIITNK